MNKKPIKCDRCGQFIAYLEGGDYHFTPDTEFTIEELICRCSKCVNKYGKIMAYEEKTLYEEKEKTTAF